MCLYVLCIIRLLGSEVVQSFRESIVQVKGYRLGGTREKPGRELACLVGVVVEEREKCLYSRDSAAVRSSCIGFTRTQHSKQRQFLSQLIPSIDSFVSLHPLIPDSLSFSPLLPAWWIVFSPRSVCSVPQPSGLSLLSLPLLFSFPSLHLRLL